MERDQIEEEKGGGMMELYVRKTTTTTTTTPPFLLKTFMLVEDSNTDDVISWNEDGTAFVVWQPAEFARDVLPTLFKHSNFSSFVRQLNTYGFRKVTTSRWEFCNDMFRKGERKLLCDIRRRKTWSNKQQPTNNIPDNATPQETIDEDQRSSSTSSSSGYDTLVDENARLKKENGVLNSELTSMKNKCNDLLNTVAKYANSKEIDDHRPKLFGVRLEVQGERDMKRIKRGESSETSSVLQSQPCK